MVQIESEYWKKEFLIDEIETGDFTKLRISITEDKKGQKHLVYREWYHTAKDATEKPSRHGGAIPLISASNVISTFQTAVAQAKILGWL